MDKRLRSLTVYERTFFLQSNFSPTVKSSHVSVLSIMRALSSDVDEGQIVGDALLETTTSPLPPLQCRPSFTRASSSS